MRKTDMEILQISTVAFISPDYDGFMYISEPISQVTTLLELN